MPLWGLSMDALASVTPEGICPSGRRQCRRAAGGHACLLLTKNWVNLIAIVDLNNLQIDSHVTRRALAILTEVRSLAGTYCALTVTSHRGAQALLAARMVARQETLLLPWSFARPSKARASRLWRTKKLPGTETLLQPSRLTLREELDAARASFD